MSDLRPPFPYFGGKRKVAPLVWDRFGVVATYNEPFFGAGAVLLGRPGDDFGIETINDIDCFLVNFWRAVQWAPERVAFWADGPVNEADLHSRHRWLVGKGRRLVQRCLRDPHYFNAKIAGWWVWGIALWIGSGWCQQPNWSGRVNVGRWPRGVHGLRTAATRIEGNPSEQRKRPRGDGGTGIHADWVAGPGKRPYLADRVGGTGVHRRWNSGGQAGGQGVHSPTLWQQKPDLSGDSGAAGRGIHGMTVTTEGLYGWFDALCHRLRRVRVLCGDWRRTLTPSVTTYIGLSGIFLDPPYQHDLRERCYAEDHDISADVLAWALEHGDDPLMRIALCGYEEEHGPFMPATWEKVAWKAHGGYSRSARGVANRSEERIWFSPYCLKPTEPRQVSLLLED